MKKSILTCAAFMLIAGGMLSSCNTPAQKVENAQDNVAAAKDDLTKANEEYLADIEVYRQVTADKIAANNKSITEFNARTENKKEAAKSDYQRKVAELEQKNSDLKKKLDDYKAEGKNNWEQFKVEFNSDMDELGEAFKNLTIKNNN